MAAAHLTKRRPDDLVRRRIAAYLNAVAARQRQTIPAPIGDAPLPEGLEWFADDGCTRAFYSATTPPAFHDDVSNTTWFSWEAWDFSTRLLKVRTYNHTTGVGTAPVTAIVSPMVDDDHGAPSMCMDAEGHVHIFGCSHGTPIYHASTLNPRDPSAWSSPITLAAGTYAHPYLVDGTLYVFLREGSNEAHLRMQKTTALAGGVPTFATSIVLGDMGSGARWYQGSGAVVGTDIHMLATREPSAGLMRRDVYYLIYDTLTGNIRNFDGSVAIASANYPVTVATLNASFRLVNQTDAGTDGNIPQLAIVDGVSHVAYMDGVTGDHRLFHIASNNGWTPLEVGAFGNNDPTHRYDALAITPNAVPGEVDLWWCGEFGGFIRGGKIVKRTRHANGTLGVQSDVKLPDRTYSLDPVVAVQNGHPDMRAVLAEGVTTPAEEQQLRAYVAGDQGIVQWPIDAPDTLNLDFTTGELNGATVIAVRDQSVSSFASRLDGSWATFARDTLRRTDKGLLVEPEGRNLLQRARTLNGSGWTQTGVVVTADQAADADGVMELELINKNVSSTGRRVSQQIVGIVGQTYVCTINAKAGTFETMSLRAVLGAQLTAKQFNLVTGEITNVGTPETAGFVSALMEYLTDGIWRCALAVTAPASGTAHVWWVVPGDLNVATQGTIYAGAAQVELGAEPSSFIPGTAAGVIRPADEIYFGVPLGVDTLLYTFEDDSTQQDAVINHGAYRIPTNLARRCIKTIVG